MPVPFMHVSSYLKRLQMLRPLSKKSEYHKCHQVTLEVNNSEAAARIVKARLERTTLGQVAKRIRATLRPVSSMAVRNVFSHKQSRTW